MRKTAGGTACPTIVTSYLSWWRRRFRLRVANFITASQVDDSALYRDRGGLRPVLHSELAQDVFNVILHRVLGNTQGVGDLFIGQSSHDQLEDLDLPRAQVRTRQLCRERG